MSDELVQEALEISIRAAWMAGDAILEVYEGDFAVQYKADSSPLTLADKQAHRLIAEILTKEFRHRLPLLSEEGRHIPYGERRVWEHFWMVDPLDGTKEFIHRRGEFTVNIALIERDRPIAGVVFVPVRGILYFAAEGIGAYRMDSAGAKGSASVSGPCKDREAPSLKSLMGNARRLPKEGPEGRRGKTLRVVASRSHPGEGLDEFLEARKREYEGVEFVAAGSALKFGLVAEGSADVYPRFAPTMEWDTAAGQCIVEQGGGAVTPMGKRSPLTYNKKNLRNPRFLCVGKGATDFKQ